MKKVSLKQYFLSCFLISADFVAPFPVLLQLNMLINIRQHCLIFMSMFNYNKTGNEATKFIRRG